MGWQQFTVSLVRALAWPVLIGGVLWVFRKNVAALISGLDRFKLGWGTFFAEAQRAAIQAEAEANATVNMETVHAKATIDGGGVLTVTPTVQFVPISIPDTGKEPSPQVIVGFVYETVTALVRRTLREDGLDVDDWSRLILVAHERGFVSTDSAVALRGLQTLYDFAMASARSVSANDASEFLTMANATWFAVVQNVNAMRRKMAQ